MGIHRFQLLGGLNAQVIPLYTENGGSIDDQSVFYLDISLTNDGDLGDLQDYMESVGFSFSESSPTLPPNDSRQVLSFSQTALTLASSTDNFFGLSGASLGTIGTALGIDSELCASSPGRVEAITLRSDTMMDVDLFIVINGSRTVMASDVTLTAAAIVSATLSAQPEWAADAGVEFGIVEADGSETIDLNVTVEIRIS